MSVVGFNIFCTYPGSRTCKVISLCFTNNQGAKASAVKLLFEVFFAKQQCLRLRQCEWVLELAIFWRVELKKLQEEKLERSQNVHILSQHFSISLFLILNDRQCGTSLVCFQTANTKASALVDI